MCKTSDKTRVHLLFNNGLTMLESGQYRHARACFEQVLENASEDVETLANIGLACFLVFMDIENFK